MSTNYYWHPRPACETCGRDFGRFHIGKRSGGWEFGFRGYRHHDGPGESNVQSLADWRSILPLGVIKDEYGDALTPNEFLSLVEETRGGLSHARIALRHEAPGQLTAADRDYIAWNPQDWLVRGFFMDEWLDPEGWSFTSREFS